jgi:hypothetical protein
VKKSYTVTQKKTDNLEPKDPPKGSDEPLEAVCVAEGLSNKLKAWPPPELAVCPSAEPAGLSGGGASKPPPVPLAGFFSLDLPAFKQQQHHHSILKKMQKLPRRQY